MGLLGFPWGLSVSLAVVYLGFYIALVFLSLSIASGLYYLAEMIEEYTITTRRLISWAIRAELALHAALALDRLPASRLALGAGAHLLHARLLRRFPYVSPLSADALAAAAGAAAATAGWATHFWRSYYTAEYIAAFCLVTTWLVPAAFALSLAGEHAVLPGAGGAPYSAGPYAAGGGGGGAGAPRGGGGGGGGAQRQRRNLALRAFDALRRKRDAYLPGVAARVVPDAFSLKEKL